MTSLSFWPVQTADTRKTRCLLTESGWRAALSKASVLSYIYLTEGDHILALDTSWGWIRVDALEIQPSLPMPADLYDVSPVLVTPDPSPEAQRMFAWMCDIYGKKIITGQNCDGGMFGMENQAVWRATEGAYPALLGLDMMDYSPSRVERGSQGKSVDHAIQYWEKGGIVTFCWHWNAPSPYLKEERWYSGFYTEYSTINLKKIMDGEDPQGYELLMKDLDAIAVQLGRLRDAGVPVLWRPLHEASGGWFWWGASGPEAYKWLWNLMFEKFTGEYHLNNLIWVWNGQHADWYPGDDTVDMIGEDIYPEKRKKEIDAIADPKLRNNARFLWKLLDLAAQRSFGVDLEHAELKRKFGGKWVSGKFRFSLSSSENGVAGVAVSNADVELSLDSMLRDSVNRTLIDPRVLVSVRGKHKISVKYFWADKESSTLMGVHQFE